MSQTSFVTKDYLHLFKKNLGIIQLVIFCIFNKDSSTNVDKTKCKALATITNRNKTLNEKQPFEISYKMNNCYTST